MLKPPRPLDADEIEQVLACDVPARARDDPAYHHRRQVARATRWGGVAAAAPRPNAARVSRRTVRRGPAGGRLTFDR
jgi:hypothetical protein